MNTLSVDDEISMLYRELRSMRDKQRFKDDLARLRQLQEDEAQRMKAAFEERLVLRPGTVHEAIQAADALLATKEFKPIRKTCCREAICAALNKLFWKVPFHSRSHPRGDPSSITTDEALSWVAELRDRDIEIQWDAENECFIP